MPTLALEPGVQVSTALTLAELFVTQNEDQIREQLLATLRTNGFPVTDWYAGSVGRTIVELVSSALADAIAGDPAQSNGLIPQITSAGYVDFAELLDADSVQRRWLTLLARELYKLDRFAATRTTGTVVLTCATGAGPISISNRQLTFSSLATGNRYVGPTEAGPLLLPDGGTLSITVESEFPNDSLGNPPLNYVDASGTITNMVTVLAGVTANNPAPTFSPVSLVGIGSGIVTPTPTVPGAVTPTSVAILITSDGQRGIATWSLSLNGLAYVAQGTTPVSYNIPATNITIGFANGFSSPSFRANDVYTFAAPGSFVITQGTDEETNKALATRCRSRWPDLSDVPTADVYSLWSRQATPQVTQVKSYADTVIPGRVNVIVAGQAGALPAGVIATVQSYINIRQPITDKAVVASATPTVITLAGTVTVSSAKLAIAQQAAQINVAIYINSVGIGGTLRVSAIIEQIMIGDGAIDVSGLTINGGGNLALSANSVASFVQVLATSLTWVTV